MRWRRLFPAIAVGAGTVLTDDPSLTARHYEEETWSPIRFVFDSLLRSWSASKTLYSDSFSHRTILVTTETAPSELVLQVEKAGIQCTGNSPHKREGPAYRLSEKNVKSYKSVGFSLKVAANF